jgi:hypothetical protein
VTELIQGYIVGRTLETTEAELMETVFPHPTLSEMMHESVLDATDGAALLAAPRQEREPGPSQDVLFCSRSVLVSTRVLVE